MQSQIQELGERQKELAALIERFTGVDGTHSTPIPCLDLLRSSSGAEPIVALQEPSLCIVAQGKKQVWLGDSSYFYSPSEYLLVSVDLPMAGKVIGATPAHPYLALRLGIDSLQIGDIVAQADFSPLDERVGSESVSHDEQKWGKALAVSQLSPALLDSVIRLVQLLESPRDVSVLLPLRVREILYHLLMGEQSHQLRQIAVHSSQIHRIALAIDWLKHNYIQSVRIEEMARIAHMSPSGFHHHFKAVTAMTPLQFQKQLRLQEARRLLLNEDIDASTVSYRVGYESPSQFSREYSRLFGAPPLRDITRLRGTLAIA